MINLSNIFSMPAKDFTLGEISLVALFKRSFIVLKSTAILNELFFILSVSNAVVFAVSPLTKASADSWLLLIPKIFSFALYAAFNLSKEFLPFRSSAFFIAVIHL